MELVSTNIYKLLTKHTHILNGKKLYPCSTAFKVYFIYRPKLGPRHRRRKMFRIKVQEKESISATK